MENIITSEICKKCAACCKNYPFVELSQNEIHELEKLTGWPSDVFTHQKGVAVEEYFLRFKENGDCFFLNENNGDYSCSVYEARSGICRNYPSKPGENKVCESNREMILRNNSGGPITGADPKRQAARFNCWIRERVTDGENR